MNRIHLAAALLLAWIGAGAQNHPSQRPAEKDRLFRSDAVEAKIREVGGLLTNPRLAWMFANCYPNTLDTTVHFGKDEDVNPRTFVYTPCGSGIPALKSGPMSSSPMRTRT